MVEASPMQVLQKRFHELKDQDNNIKGNSIFSILKPFFKFIHDSDFQAVFRMYVVDFSLNDIGKVISLSEIKYIFLSMQEQFQKIRSSHAIAVFQFQNHYVLKKSGFSSTYLPQITKKPMFQISSKELTDIVPYEIIFFDSLYKRQDKPSMKTLQKFTEQSLDQPYYCYDYKIYEVLLENFEGPAMNKLVRLFYKIIDFNWIQAFNFFKSQIINDPKMKQAPFLTPIFQNLKQIQQQINKSPNILKPLFQKRKSLQYPNLQNLSFEILKKVNEQKNIYEFVCSFCFNIYKQIQNPYLRAICYFLSRKSQVGCKFQQICNNKHLDLMIKFLFARRFLSPNDFKDFNERFLIQTREDPKLQHIMFLKNKNDVVQTISNYYDNHPNEFERVALTCGIILHKLGKGFSKQHPFLQHMVKIYEQILRNFTSKQDHKQYMLKMMSVRSAKQPIWQDLIIKPQFKLNCEPRNHDCVFLSMLEKFIYGGDQKWNKLKTKVAIPAQQIKKHYEVQTKYCPYCNYPNPRCSICLQQIKIFTVKSYLNQQIKRKTEKQQKPYMKLNQPLQQALIWCPGCGHGGHFGHLQPWFKQQKSCPVSGCNCKCKF